MYTRGPLRKARPAIAETQAREKQVVNLAGATMIAPSKKKHKSMKKAAAAKQTVAHMKLFSLLRQLNIASQPYGSGSLRPSTNSFALVKELDTAFLA